MNIVTAASLLLRQFSPEERSIPDSVDFPGRNADVLAAMNGALQELFGQASPWVRRDERGYLVRESTTVTISVTEGSKAATITSGWASWMAGCTIVISGSTSDNQIRNDSASVVLRTPHDGPTGSVSAVVYCDSIPLDDDIIEVVAPIRLDRKHLSPVPSGSHNPLRRHDRDYGFHQERLTFQTENRASETAGEPLSYAVVTWSPSGTEAPETRIRLQPIPKAKHVLELEALLKPPVLLDISSADELPIPAQFVETIFVPVATQRLKASSFFRADPGKEEEIGRAYQVAITLLHSLNPRKNTGRKLVSPY